MLVAMALPQLLDPHPEIHPQYDRGNSTALELNCSYRASRFAERVHGRWLDCGCADGGYVQALLACGADEVHGIDVEDDRIDEAIARQIPNAHFRVATGEQIPFDDKFFDGALVNEVLEHVEDDQLTLHELHRVIRPGGTLVVNSPNRWFPFEGHGITVAGRSINKPVPIVPWLPAAMTKNMMRARNYWPYQLRSKIENAGFSIDTASFVMPVLELYPWVPKAVQQRYQAALPNLHKVPGVRRFGVSCFFVARRRF